MTGKKRCIKIIAAVVALILLLVFVPFPLRINRTYYGHIHQGESAGKDVTLRLKGWRLNFLCFPEKWKNVKLSMTADDGTELNSSLFTLTSGFEIRSIFAETKQYTLNVAEMDTKLNRIELWDVLLSASLREIAIYKRNDALIVASTDRNKSDSDILKKFQSHLKAYGFVF